MSDLRKALQPGDILNTEGFKFDVKKLFESLAIKIVLGIIVSTQKKVFGKILRKGPYQDTHTMMYFDPESILSVTIPKPCFEKLEKYESKEDPHIVSVYRMNPNYFGRMLTEKDIQIMRSAANQIVLNGKKYDIGQLVDILVNTTAGYPYTYSLQWFNADGPLKDDNLKTHLVCSVGVASIIAYWRHELQKKGEEIPQPWKKLNAAFWPDEILKSFPRHWDIGATFPANFATTHTHFFNEFILVGRFKNGKRLKD